jgi:N-acetyl-anhydromuramoyl-L-alanine amidase
MPGEQKPLWTDGWLQQCIHVPSPNFSQRPQHTEISLVVLHNISLPPFEYGQQAVQRLFTNQIGADEPDDFMRSLIKLRVSSHFLLERNGALTQFVSCADAAFQAGVSRFDGREGCNAFSIGIELEGCDFEPFTESQYAQLGGLLQTLCECYPIKAVTGHQHVAPGRKSDPGHFFQWDRLRAQGLPVTTEYQWLL